MNQLKPSSFNIAMLFLFYICNGRYIFLCNLKLTAEALGFMSWPEAMGELASSLEATNSKLQVAVILVQVQ